MRWSLAVKVREGTYLEGGRVSSWGRTARSGNAFSLGATWRIPLWGGACLLFALNRPSEGSQRTGLSTLGSVCPVCLCLRSAQSARSAWACACFVLCPELHRRSGGSHSWGLGLLGALALRCIIGPLGVRLPGAAVRLGLHGASPCVESVLWWAGLFGVNGLLAARSCVGSTLAEVAWTAPFFPFSAASCLPIMLLASFLLRYVHWTGPTAPYSLHCSCGRPVVLFVHMRLVGCRSCLLFAHI